MYKDKWQNKLIDQLAFKYGIDKRVVQEVVYYPMSFTKQVMNDPKDDTPIRIKHLGVFAYRGSRTKETVEKPKYDTLIQAAEDLYEVEYKKNFEDLDAFVEYIVDCFKNKEYSAIRDIHQIFVKKVKYARKMKQ